MKRLQDGGYAVDQWARRVMDLDTGTIVAGFIVGTIGFSVFLYGKKQNRLPQLVAGLVLMALPIVVSSPWWLAGASALVLAGTWGAVHRGA